jgi:Tfp pilus assembly protein PilZ
MEERRRYRRVREEDSVVIVVLYAPDARDLENKTFFCSTQDISYDGLRFRIYRAMPVGAVLQLLVAVMDPPRAYKHVGTVIWSEEETKDHHHTIGVKFTKTPPDVLRAWQDMMRVRLTESAG